MDLKNEEDKTTLKKMLKLTDVFIDSYRPGTLEKLNLSPDTLL